MTSSRRGFIGYAAALACTVVRRATSDSIAVPLAEWGKRGKAEGEFDIPIGLAIGPKDEVFISEFRNNRVQKFTSEGKLLSVIKTAEGPGGIAVDKRGNLYVAPLMLGKIQMFDSGGRLIREWGKVGAGDGDFEQPGGIAFGKDGSVYVADQVNRRVQQFTQDGRFIRKWGEYGVGPGQFGGNVPRPQRVGGPQFVTVDGHRFVYTTEASVGRVQKFTPDGRYVLSWGDNGTQPGGFGGRAKNLPGPIAITVDRRNRIWVSSTNHRIQCFTDTGKFLMGFGGEEGTRPGQFHTPHGMGFDSRGRMYICDTQNARIQKFKILD